MRTTIVLECSLSWGAMRYQLIPVMIVILLVAAIGCRTSTQVGTSTTLHTALPGDSSDIKWLAETVAADLLGQRFFRHQPRPPLVAFLGIQNYSSVAGAGGAQDSIRHILANSGKVRFANDDQLIGILRDMGIQQTTYSADARLAASRQLGARYAIYGWLIDIPRTAKEDAYCQLTIELTDVPSGLVVWSIPRERRILRTSVKK